MCVDIGVLFSHLFRSPQRPCWATQTWRQPASPSGPLPWCRPRSCDAGRSSRASCRTPPAGSHSGRTFLQDPRERERERESQTLSVLFHTHTHTHTHADTHTHTHKLYSQRRVCLASQSKRIIRSCLKCSPRLCLSPADSSAHLQRRERRAQTPGSREEAAEQSGKTPRGVGNFLSSSVFVWHEGLTALF